MAVALREKTLKLTPPGTIVAPSGELPPGVTMGRMSMWAIRIYLSEAPMPSPIRSTPNVGIPRSWSTPARGHAAGFRVAFLHRLDLDPDCPVRAWPAPAQPLREKGPRAI